MSSSSNPAPIGSAVTFTAQVQLLSGSATPNGTVNFISGWNDLGTATLDANGKASLTTSWLFSGPQAVTAWYYGNSDFGPSHSDLFSQVMGPNPQTINFGSLPDVVYGSGPITLNATAPSGLPVEYSSTGACAVVGATLTPTGAGPCSVTASQSGNSSWAAASPVSQNFNVNKATLSVNAVASGKTYGDADPTLTAMYSGFVGSDNASNSAITGSPVCTRDSGENVGAYTITCTPGSLAAPNYMFVTGANAVFTISQADLSITAPTISRAYGAANPAFTPTYSGFVNADTASTLTTPPTCTTAASASSAVGTYPITCSGAVDPNYSFTYVAGTLSVVIVDRFWTSSGVTLTVAAPGFLALTNVGGSTVVVSQAPKGKLTLGATPGAFTYVPVSGWTGTDSFAYKLKTGTALSSPTTVTIFVLGSGMNCTGCNLSGLQPGAVTLNGANLSSANFTGSALARVNLTGANLSNAGLSGAVLSSANLTGANLSSATLTDANLSSANLTGANLSSAALTGANLSGATVTGVAWSGATCPDGTTAKSHGNTCAGHLSPLAISPDATLVGFAVAVDIKEADTVLLDV